MSDIADLIEISRFAGERFDLVQAGGGNTSVKLSDGRLLVKASGMALSDVAGEGDFCVLQWQPLLDFLHQAQAKFSKVSSSNPEQLALFDHEANSAVSLALTPTGRRPSIETLLHCALGKFTLHTHPVVVAAAVCRNNWREVLGNLFPQALLVPYQTPGAALALVLLQELAKSNWQMGQTIVIFLQNHGLIVAGADKQAVMQTTNEVVDSLAQHVNSVASTMGINFYRYKLVNFASALVNQVCSTNWLAYLSDDQVLHGVLKENSQYLLAGCATPDQLVYCGSTALALEDLDSPAALRRVSDFFETYGHPPKVLIAGNEHILLLAKTLRKCRDTEDVLRSHVLLQTCGTAPVEFLPPAEIKYLNNWDAEKYRQNL